MDKREDYPIKVLDLLSSPLVGVSFEMGDPPPDISLLSL
jgi:hypothetical protein